MFINNDPLMKIELKIHETFTFFQIILFEKTQVGKFINYTI